MKYWEIANRGREDCLECPLPAAACYADWRCQFSDLDAPPQSDKKIIAADEAIKCHGPMNMKTLARTIGIHPSTVARMVKSGLLTVDMSAKGRPKIIKGVNNSKKH
jgi:hypothetical protein